MSISTETVTAAARAVRLKFNIQEPPVNLFNIAKSVNIKVVYFMPSEKTKDTSGLLNRSKMEIYLNESEPAPRQNFTLAHELAHYFLDHKTDEYGVYNRSSFHQENKTPQEQEADLFAAELLMPEELIIKVKAERSLSDEGTVSLASIFGVSIPAMEYRLRELKNA